jgi:hypothetical protein
MIKEDSHEQKSDYEDRRKIRTWLATRISGLGEDGAVSFRTFLTRTFLVLARARRAIASEDCLRLGVSFAVLGWICMMLFEGGGAFLPKRTTGAIAEKRVTVHVFVTLGKYFVSVKYVFVCIKLMCVYVKLFENLKCK